MVTCYSLFPGAFGDLHYWSGQYPNSGLPRQSSLNGISWLIDLSLASNLLKIIFIIAILNRHMASGHGVRSRVNTGGFRYAHPSGLRCFSRNGNCLFFRLKIPSAIVIHSRTESANLHPQSALYPVICDENGGVCQRCSGCLRWAGRMMAFCSEDLSFGQSRTSCVLGLI
jgi:hypothetical protein